MRNFLWFVPCLVACTANGGFSLHSGGEASSSPSSPSSSSPAAHEPTHAITAEATRQEIAANGHPFDVNKDCYGEHGRVDYHRDPILYWPCFEYSDLRDTPEYSDFAKNCDEVNDRLKGAGTIACQMDHKGFDAHFAAQAKVPRNADRDGSDPGSYCSSVFAELAGRSAAAANTLGMWVKTPATRGELLAKVSKITCAYDEAKGETAELVGKNLILYTKQSYSANWVLLAIRRTKAFPELEKLIAEYGACQGGFSC